jgi:class 3 adenylate cyclase
MGAIALRTGQMTQPGDGTTGMGTVVPLRPDGGDVAPATGVAGAAVRSVATVLFTDIVGSTELALSLGDEAWLELLDRHDAAVASALQTFEGTLVVHLGDGVLATFATPAAAVACAWAIQGAVADLGLAVRAGVHAGECQVSGTSVRGIAVHVGARVSALAGAGEVLVARTVRDLLLGSAVTFAERGVHELKGLPSAWELFGARPRG